MVSTNDGQEEEYHDQAQLTQPLAMMEKEYIQSFFRNHAKNFERHPRKAAQRCVRGWQELYPDKVNQVTVKKVLDYGRNAGNPNQLAVSALKKHNASLPRLIQSKKGSPNVQVPCVDFPPCQRNFMYIDGLVDHILQEHASKKSMQCDCSEAFTRRADLRSHVELTHTGAKILSPSVSAYAGADALGEHSRSAESVSLDQPPSNPESRVLLRCTDFPPCSKSFKDQRSFNDHVRSHKGWGTRQGGRGSSSAEARKTKMAARASSSRTVGKIAGTTLSIDRPNSSPPPQGTKQEVRIVGARVEPEVTAASSQAPSGFIGDASGRKEDSSPLTTTATANVRNTEAIALSEPQTINNASQESASQVDACFNHPGMRLLPNIEKKLRRNIMNELEEAAAQTLPDPRQIFRHMQTITKTTSDAIAKMLKPYHYVSFVEYQATCLNEVTELSAVVFGDTRDQEILKIAYGIQSQKRLTAETMLQAYTAAAVTQWVLRIDLRDSYGARGTICNAPDHRRQSMEDFIKRATPELYSVLQQKYYHNYLQEQVAPSLDCRSWELANKLYHVLNRLFNGKVSELERSSPDQEGANAADLRMNLSNSVRLLLFQIFKEGHELCLLMHKHPLGYDISFPTWPEKYVAEDMRTVELQYPHSKGQVCISVCPRISHKDSLETVVPASVLLI